MNLFHIPFFGTISSLPGIRGSFLVYSGRPWSLLTSNVHGLPLFVTSKLVNLGHTTHTKYANEFDKQRPN